MGSTHIHASSPISCEVPCAYHQYHHQTFMKLLCLCGLPARRLLPCSCEHSFSSSSVQQIEHQSYLSPANISFRSIAKQSPPSVTSSTIALLPIVSPRSRRSMACHLTPRLPRMVQLLLPEMRAPPPQLRRLQRLQAASPRESAVTAN
jgi:hypothetical protein